MYIKNIFSTFGRYYNGVIKSNNCTDIGINAIDYYEKQGFEVNLIEMYKTNSVEKDPNHVLISLKKGSNKFLLDPTLRVNEFVEFPTNEKPEISYKFKNGLYI